MALYTWADIKNEYTDGIVLGNGASIAVDARFGYGSLLTQARQGGLITERLNRIFDHFDSVDFEYVLEMLWHAARINEALGVDDSETARAYQEVRTALIGAVRHVHPEHHSVVQHLPQIGAFLKDFRTVLCLNYDLLVYWAMLQFNSEIPGEGRWFKDCFFSGHVHPRWQDLREPLDAQGATLVFYPHGHLALATDVTGTEQKITAAGNRLIDRIVESWEQGALAPVFVSEAKPKKKVEAISRSRYLRTVFSEVIPEQKESVVLYGWNIGRQDAHILTQLRKASISRIAVSVHIPTAGDLDEHCTGVQRKLTEALGPHLEVVFFDAESPGAWIY